VEKFLVRIFGFIWIGITILASFTIAEKPSGSGMAICFLLMSLGMTYFHFSGIFDPERSTT